MGLASHLGPWLLGTQKNTTGSTTRNMGATSVSQFKSVAYTDSAATVACVLPAGSLITNIAIYSSTAFVGTTPTITVSIAGTAVTTALALTSGTAINSPFTYASTTAAGALLANVGTTDASVTYTIGGTGLSAGAATLVIEYAVRNADGTIYPTYNNA